jgi:hypothetical protein
MESWKRALVIGAAGTAALLFLQRRKTAGIVVAGVSLAVLAAEYPEKFAEIRERLPEFVERGSNYLDVVARVGERIADFSEGRGSAWYDALLRA